jgi:hypothetical protein
MKQIRRYVLLPLAAYACYLAALGPFSALEGNGSLNVIPASLRELCWYPSAPVWTIRSLRHCYADYLDSWYRDPNLADPPHDW